MEDNKSLELVSETIIKNSINKNEVFIFNNILIILGIIFIILGIIFIIKQKKISNYLYGFELYKKNWSKEYLDFKIQLVGIGILIVGCLNIVVQLFLK